jgi:hypothetical protein
MTKDPLSQKILEFLRNRIATMGETQSGALNYYAFRAERGIVLATYESEILEVALTGRPLRIVHAGIGIGQLLPFVAQAGIPAVGFEFDNSRFKAAVDMRDWLGLDYELRHSKYPGDGDLGNGGVLLFTNVDAGWNDETERSIIETFHLYDRVLLDLRLFGRVRDDNDGRGELLGRLEAVGAVSVIPTISGAHYVEIKPTARNVSV